MAHCNLVLTCCQCRYSSTFACASGSLGYQWSSMGNVFERYFMMAIVSFNGVPLCVANGTYKVNWKIWVWQWNDGIWTFWQGLILVISSLKWSPFLIMSGLNSWGILAALQNITKALEGCDIKSAKILSVILLKVKNLQFFLFVVDIQNKQNAKI